MNTEKNVDFQNNQQSEDKINLLPNIDSNKLYVNINAKKSPKEETFSITCSELENMVSNYTDLNNKMTLLESIEFLGGTKGILEKLKTSENKGIIPSFEREKNYGSNKIFEEPPASFIKFLKESLSELMIVILLSAAIIQIILGLTISEQKKTGWLDGASVLFAVFVVVLVESFTNWEKEKKFYELNNLKNIATFYKTLRNKKIENTKSEDLQVGDIIFISMGDTIPADLLVIESNNLKIDENSLTGESHPVLKESFENCLKNQNAIKNISPIILSGSDCVEGRGKALVVGVGEHSTKGKIQRMVDSSKEEKCTPLEEKLDIFAKKIGIFAISAGICTFLCLSLRLIFIFFSDYKYYKEKLHHNPTMNLVHPKTYLFPKILENFMITTVIITIALPEGLPMAVALTLAFSLKKLMDKNNLVRKMHSCETMGGANYILTDKTGTLTTNDLSVVKILNLSQNDINIININSEEENNKNKIYIEGFNNDIKGNSEKFFKNKIYWNLLRNAISLNVDSHINYNENNEEIAESKNKTDNALIKFLYKINSPLSEIYNKFNFDNDKKNIKQIPFDSNKKRMSTYIKNNTTKKYYLYTKGGSENIKNFCSYYINSSTGQKEKLSEEMIQKLENNLEKCNNDMLRTIYICYKEISEEEYNNVNTEQNLDTFNLILLAVFCIRDTIREGVKEAVLKCQQASINVIMVTGDNIQTAHSIAKECNIIPKNSNFLQNSKKFSDENNSLLLSNPPEEINGDVFYELIGGIYCSSCGKNNSQCVCPKTYAEADMLNNLNDNNNNITLLRNDKIKNIENFKKIIKNLKIMARSKPIHKYALVLGLKELNYIVAVTGDGTNDAPALSKSDVGFAMMNGTDIAKNSSDIILLDNNFSSIITAIKYGRNIIENLRKFIQFQLVINLTVCSFIVICSCIGSETPIRSIQMLWIDLIMDSLATLTLATEPPYDELLNKKPTRYNESIITPEMIKHVIYQTFVLFFLLMFIYLCGPLFIEEENLLRLNENKLIKECYGILPGMSMDENKIIFGVKTFWNNNIEINDYLVKNNKCGEYGNYNTLNKAFKLYNKNMGAPVQLTMVFNIFVLYTLFNQLNCRIVDGSFNIFSRIKNNKLFIFIEIFEFFVQFIIIEYWNVIFKATKNGLTLRQWGICILFSSVSLAVDFLLKIKI